MPGTKPAVARRSRQHRPWPAPATALAIIASALLLGVYGDVGLYAPGFWGRLPEAGTPWVVPAFIGGRGTRNRALGSLAGAGLVLRPAARAKVALSWLGLCRRRSDR